MADKRVVTHSGSLGQKDPAPVADKRVVTHSGSLGQKDPEVVQAAT